MSRRSRAREVVLQVLYADDLNPAEEVSARDDFLCHRLGQDEALIAFARSLWVGVRRDRDELDRLLGERAEHWSLQRMAVTDRNILRLGAYEMLHTDTPNRVAIDEALELAKRYGTRHSSQFVNGILDRLLRDCGDKDRLGS